MKLCECLTEKTVDLCKEFIKNSDADMIEHRLDFMDRIEGLKEIYASTTKPVIVTNRALDNGGLFEGGNGERLEYLVEAIEAGASFVDIELDNSAKCIAEIMKVAMINNCKCIVSKHFSDRTPSNSVLSSILSRILFTGANIAKIVTTPRSLSDCQRILKFQLNESRAEVPLIAFAMGNLGKFTRVSSLFLGAPFMYVAQDTGPTAAPGQVPMSEMRRLLEVLQ